MKIEFENVTAGYGTPILRNVSFSFMIGERIAIMGRSGSGKTTLLKVLSGQLPIHAGTIRLVDVMPSSLAVAPQTPVTFSWLTVREHLTTLAPPQLQPLLPQLLELLTLQEHGSKYPPELSGGTLKRLAVGMALSLQRSFVLLDEPTSGLDDLSKEGAWKAIRDFTNRANDAVILVTHSIIEALWMANRVIAIAPDGGIALDEASPAIAYHTSSPWDALANLEVREFITKLRLAMGASEP